VKTLTELEIRVDCDEGCFDLPQWRSLLGQDPDAHVFATPEWNRLWWEEFGSGKDLFILTMARGDQPTAIVPLYRCSENGKRILRFIGGVELTDYLGPICSLEDRDDVARALVDWLISTEVEWDEFDAHCMPVPFGFAEYLVDWADRAGLEFWLEQEEVSALLPLPQDWDSYLASLRSKERHELKRKRNRFERNFPDARVRSSTPETLEADIQTFVDMHRGAEGHKGHFMNPEIAGFFRRIAAAFAEKGWLRLDLLEVGDEALASTFGFEIDGTFYLYNSAYEPDYAQSSPGLVLVSELIERSIDQGVKVFDLLRGSERYKYQLGAKPVPLNNAKIKRRVTG
jgi:CelD/BcsL family acetyltransferase involved in cellulose biosynthesis